MINRYPYTDAHELNLDYILAQIKKLSEEYKEFVALNTITYAGLWDITKSYQKWTVVIDGGVGYMSLQAVPAGINILNTEYWTMVFDMYSVFKNDVVILGDSYAVDASAGGDSWASQVERNLPANINVYRSTIGGMGFASDMYLSNNFLTMLQNLTITDKDAVKHILILGGANDANLYYDGTSTLQDIEDRIDAFMNYCQTNFINAKVELAFVGWYLNLNRYNAYRAVREIYQRAGNKHMNCAYYSNGECIMHNQAMINSLDYIHPVQASSDKLATFAMSMVANGNYNDIYADDITVTRESNISLLDGIDFAKILYDNDKARMTFYAKKWGGYIQVVLTTPISPDTADTFTVPIATLGNTPLIEGTFSDYKTYFITCGIDGQGSKTCRAQVSLYNNQLVVKVFDIAGYTTGWQLQSILLGSITLDIDRRMN